MLNTYLPCVPRDTTTIESANDLLVVLLVELLQSS